MFPTPFAAYKGRPYTGQPQTIPGKITAVHFDLGGEGIAYHDFDTANPGSGGLNKGNSDLDRFRIAEAVGVSYTKPDMDTLTDGMPLPIGQLYMGWTAPGEWVNYTIHVQRGGKYRVNAFLSSAFEAAQISFAINGADKTGPLVIPTTGHWHKWRAYENLAELTLDAGPQILTLHFLQVGNMNVMHLEFIPA